MSWQAPGVATVTSLSAHALYPGETRSGYKSACPNFWPVHPSGPVTAAAAADDDDYHHHCHRHRRQLMAGTSFFRQRPQAMSSRSWSWCCGMFRLGCGTPCSVQVRSAVPTYPPLFLSISTKVMGRGRRFWTSRIIIHSSASRNRNSVIPLQGCKMTINGRSKTKTDKQRDEETRKRESGGSKVRRKWPRMLLGESRRKTQ